MIAPQELRLGNYFQVPTMPYLGLQKVQAITGKYISGIDFNLVEPIELTEDWLLKFGFEKLGDNNFKLGDYSILITKIEIRFIICNYMDIPPSVKLKYVHQLQNLYFALTGEELTIKE